MQRTEPPFLAAAICLAALAGFVDAEAFASLGGFFASFMSGNATRFAVAFGSGVRSDAMVAGAMILSFVSGVILATVIVRARPDRFRVAVMGAVAALLAGAALVAELRQGPPALLLLAVAMGAAHVLIRRHGEPGGGAVHLTESLVRMGEGLADALMGVRGVDAWLPHLLLWGGFLAGAVLGGGAYYGMGLRSLWFAVAAAVVLAIWFSRRLVLPVTPVSTTNIEP